MAQYLRQAYCSELMLQHNWVNRKAVSAALLRNRVHQDMPTSYPVTCACVFTSVFVTHMPTCAHNDWDGIVNSTLCTDTDYSKCSSTEK